jgi:Xaa-Pro aminopeptidase
MDELNLKMSRVRGLLEQHRLDALLLQRATSFAWATCGGLSYINTASTTGEASLLITREDARYLITNNIEAPHYEREEGLAAQGWQFRLAPWHAANPALPELTRGMRLGSDYPYPGAEDLSVEMARLRAVLTLPEQARFRAVCADGAAALEAAARAVRPGQTEMEIAGLIELESRRRLLQPVVALVASDQRISDLRHPLPTPRRLERYAMLIVCARRQGLVMAATRLVHFGKLPAEIRRRAEAAARVDAQVICATRPGRTLGEIFGDIQRAYAEAGFDGEWQRHPQGGPIAYEPREFLAVPGSPELVSIGEGFAWNPSITGAKSEDTILVTEAGVEVLTATGSWPEWAVEAGGRSLPRPAILEVI